MALFLQIDDSTYNGYGYLTQNALKLSANALGGPEGDWDLIHGELMIFIDAAFN